MRTKNEKQAKRVEGPRQREVLRDVMLSAAQCGSWLTLRELSRLTNYGETSISAQLQHLRKARYGAVWEYRLRGVWRPETRRDWFSAPLLPPSPPSSTKGMTPAAKSCAWKLNSHCRKNKTTSENQITKLLTP
jgi:hypothetical protein